MESKEDNLNDFVSNLDLSTEEIRRLGNQAIELVAQYYESIRNLPILPDTSSEEIKQSLDNSIPEEGEDFSSLLEIFRNTIIPFSRHNGHPRFFGYVSSPGTAAAAIADMLASALNSNVTSWRSAPAPTEIELLTIDWIKQIIGFDKNALGLFTSGGSMANFAGLAAALNAKAPVDVSNDGIQSLGKRMRIYMSEEGHHSIIKAAGLLGIGKVNVQMIPVDEQFKIDISHLREGIEEDLSKGHLPFCIVANAGTVSTGAFDSIEEVIEVARKYNLWVHVDASYGGFAALAPSAKHHFRGIEETDSISLDPHKWLYLPIDCGCVLYRDRAAAQAASGHSAEYIRVIEKDDEAFAFWDYTPELSRRFRALKVWMMLRHVGTRKLSKAIENNINCAKYFERLIKESNDFEMLAPVESSIFCFRYLPLEVKEEQQNCESTRAEELNRELDILNERIMIELQRRGNSYLSNASINGHFVLRGCIINYRTTIKDMEILLKDVQQLAREIREL